MSSYYYILVPCSSAKIVILLACDSINSLYSSRTFARSFSAVAIAADVPAPPLQLCAAAAAADAAASGASARLYNTYYVIYIHIRIHSAYICDLPKRTF